IIKKYFRQFFFFFYIYIYIYIYIYSEVFHKVSLIGTRGRFLSSYGIFHDVFLDGGINCFTLPRTSYEWRKHVHIINKKVIIICQYDFTNINKKSLYYYYYSIPDYILQSNTIIDFDINNYELVCMNPDQPMILSNHQQHTDW